MKNKLRKIFIFSILALPVVLRSAFEKIESGAAPHALGNALAASRTSVYAIYYNPANIAAVEKGYIVFDYRTFYGIKALNQLDLITSIRIQDLPFSLAFHRFGDYHYSEYQFFYGSAITIIERMSLGFSFQYYSLQIKDYGQSGAWGLNLGVFYAITDYICIGAMFTNLNQPTIGAEPEYLPQTYSIGLNYKPLESLKLNIEFFRDVRYQQDYRAGISYQFCNELILRLGMQDKNNSYAMGFGTKIQRFCFDYTLLIHQILGYSQLVSFQIEL